MQILKKAVFFLYEQFYYYLLYIIKHPICSLVILAGVLSSYGSYAFAEDYYVDSEVIINIPGTDYNWLEIGRYGLVAVRRLLNTNWYNPYYTGILLLFFLWLTGMTFSYVSSKLFPRLSPAVTTLGSLIFLTYPTFAEQYYFQFQSAEIAFGLWLSILSAGMFYLFVRDRRWSCFYITLPVYVLTFAVYQSFIPLTLCTYLAVFLSLIFRKETDAPVLKRGIAGSIIHFLAAMVIYQCLDRILFPSSGYLTDQVVWSASASFVEALRTVIYSCLRMLTGQGIFYTTLLLPASLLCAASFFLYRKADLFRVVLGALAALGIALTPFALTFLMGENTAIRSQFTYGLSAVFLLYFSMQSIWDYMDMRATSCSSDGPAMIRSPRALRSGMAIALLVITLSQIATVRYIWKAHSYVADFDRKTATRVMEVLYDAFTVCDNVGTIFWGYLQPETPYDEVIADSPSYLFTSVFNLEHATEPYCYFSTVRILAYMESMGHKFALPTHRTQNVSAFIMNRENLTAFPEEGCLFHDFEAFTLNLGNCPDYYY